MTGPESPASSDAVGTDRLRRLIPSGIRARLFLLIALVLLPLALLMTWVYHERYQTRRSLAFQTEVEVAEGVAMTFSNFVNGLRRQNYSLGQAIIRLSPPVTQNAVRLLALTAQNYPSVRNFSWTNTDGLVIASSDSALAGRDLSSRPYFRQLMHGSPWSIGDVTATGTSSTAPIFAIATAIRDEKGALRGMVVAGIEPERLGELALTQQRLTGGAYAIFDRQGTLVFRSTSPSLSWETRRRWSEQDAVLQRTLETGKPHIGITQVITGGSWVSARVPIPAIGWVAGAGTPSKAAFAPVNDALRREILLGLAVFAFAFLLAAVAARTISVPLLRLERDTHNGEKERIAASDLLAPKEVSRVRRAVYEMMAEIGEAEKRFRLALGNIPDSIVIYDSDLRIRYVNPNMTAYTGLPESHFIGRKGSEIWPAFYELWHDGLVDVLESGRVRKMELDLPFQNGMRNFIVTFVPLFDPGNEVTEIMGIGHEYTERKQAETELKRAMEELVQTNRELEQFAFVASHDLQEPLRMVASYVQLLEKRYRDRLDERGVLYIDYAVEGATRMKSLIEDLLAFSRIARGEEFGPVDLNEVFEETTGYLGETIRQSGGEVTRGDLPIVTGDRTQLLQLFRNLLSNSLKYRRPEAPPSIRVEAQLQGNEWVFSVADNGIGIEPAYFERIFHIFQRLHARHLYPGTGIGLATCRKIVERHRGRIWVESTPGEGSTFFFTLPA
ncbi:ATP-binding protein [Geobacter sp. DSM 9736]|uniref:sensor histidine kinase n=1 Tax=Geobacter sp. DSM 9736 TaxID=1277350 RepID=UPI000B503999|nr:ATP-binding protein [Geobacter sp. DSM 9736]SNB44753.1 PAS domain S-box-containing protein [Geobacter sp. DSM 9736]